jgi:hypothetical protein
VLTEPVVVDPALTDSHNLRNVSFARLEDVNAYRRFKPLGSNRWLRGWCIGSTDRYMTFRTSRDVDGRVFTTTVERVEGVR